MHLDSFSLHFDDRRNFFVAVSLRFSEQRKLVYITFIMGFRPSGLPEVSGAEVTKLYFSRVSARVFSRISAGIFQKALAFFPRISYAKHKEIVSSAVP